MITVRPAGTADIPAIRAVAVETWRATYAGLIAAPDIESFLAGAYGETSVGRTIERLGDGYLVASADDAVVGYAMAGPNREGDAELWAIYVLPAFQGRGVGRALWERAMAHLRAAAFASCTLWVLAGNSPARRFYERHGGVAIEERVDRIGESVVAEVRYRFDLYPGGDLAGPH